MKPPKDDDYPFVVIRHMAAVYERRPVIFAPSLDESRSSAFQVQWFAKFDRSSPPKAALEELIALVKRASAESGRHMCIVLAANDSIYVEPDGHIDRKSTAPAAGVNVTMDLPIPLPPRKPAH